MTVVRSVVAALVCAGLISVAAPASAQILYNSNGFEPPRFSPINLVGQDPVFAPWQIDAGPSSATVQTAVRNGGTQAVRVDRVASPTGFGSAGDTRFGVQKPTAITAQQTVIVEWDMLVPTATGTQTFGPYFCVEAYAGTNLAPKLIASAGVDAKSRNLLYQAAGTGIITEVPTILVDTNWHYFRMEMTYNGAGGGSTKLFMDNVLRQTEGFVGTAITNFNDAPLSPLSAGEPMNTANSAFYDNYSFRVVPEPTSLALVAGASVVGMAIRRLRGRKANADHG